MLKTTHRPPATPCGGLNALYPLHRNCQVVSDVCAPGDETPIGVWFDGMSLFWEHGKALTAFGMPVLSYGNYEDAETSNPGSDITGVNLDYAILAHEVDQSLPPWFTSFNNGDEESPVPVPGWEHYRYHGLIHLVGAAAGDAYALDGVPTRMGLAALTSMTFPGTTFELPVIAAVILPRWMPDHNVTYNVRDVFTNELYSTHTGALVVRMQDSGYFCNAELRQITGDEPTLDSTCYIELVTDSSIYMQGWRSLVAYKIPDQV